MKNIHVLPTDKPSRLRYNSFDKTYQLCEFPKYHTDIKSTYDIHITSDEEIKERDWVITPNPQKPLEKVTKETYLPHYNKKKKIILTTDQDLIKDGVQAIDDEFLEWFVKNPSCEEIEVNYDSFEKTGTISVWEYEIIIPREKPKCFDCKGTIKDGICFCNKEGLKQTLRKFTLTPNECYKQESLEKAAQSYLYKVMDGKRNTSYADEDFIMGAKWQQEKMFSAEDMKQSFLDGLFYSSGDTVENAIEEWFGQFKKK